MIEDDENETITLEEIANTMKEDDQTETKILNSTKASQCTHTLAYISQTVYVCKSCDQKDVGICLACALTCHQNHDIMDLGIRKGFRCDCGTPKTQTICKHADKQEDNSNKYSHNFLGLYCHCNKTFVEDDGEDMLQCLICSDWFHESHVTLQDDDKDGLTEFVCKSCANLEHTN